MREIFVLHGPNLNLLGVREPSIYGRETLDDVNRRLEALAEKLGVRATCFQSNSEGDLIDLLHRARTEAAGVVFNPGAYTHYSYALRDAVAAAEVPVIEVHLSNIYAREPFRAHSVIAPAAAGQVSGMGTQGYELALRGLCSLLDAFGRAPTDKISAEE